MLEILLLYIHSAREIYRKLSCPEAQACYNGLGLYSTKNKYENMHQMSKVEETRTAVPGGTRFNRGLQLNNAVQCHGAPEIYNRNTCPKHELRRQIFLMALGSRSVQMFENPRASVDNQRRRAFNSKRRVPVESESRPVTLH